MIIGIGIDVTEVNRIKEGIRRYKRHFLRRIFTPKEIRYCIKRKKDPNQHFAVRFAAKEAFMKAAGLGWGRKNSPGWKDIEVRNSKEGKPQLQLSGQANNICTKLKVKQVHLSLTHTTTVAAAVVILEK
ncbi:MAG: holo-ACP synthase [Planctomycetota bacterium]